MAEEKTRRVRLGGTWTYERTYPTAPPFAFRAPAGSVVTMPESAYLGIKRMNDNPGRPTLKIELVGDDVEITEGGDLVAHIEAYENELAAKGHTNSKNPPKPILIGKGASAIRSVLANAAEPGAAERTENSTEGTGGKTKGGK